MRWTSRGPSPNLEDRRGAGGGLRLGLGSTVILLVLSLIFGRDFLSFFSGSNGATPTTSSGEVAPVSQSPSEQQLVQFVSFVLDDAQDTWAKTFANRGVPYNPAKLVLFRDAVQSGCGVAEVATGPFYCPADEKVYIDLSFYKELRDRFGAPGDFAQAYVIAHELGHHVQRLLGTDADVRRLAESRPALANTLSVRLELQADCYAGIWGHSTEQRQLLEQGDVEEGLGAAAAVGDDRLQRATRGEVNPDTFTHGSSDQRVAWFRRGFTTGRLDACNTFTEEHTP